MQKRGNGHGVAGIGLGVLRFCRRLCLWGLGSANQDPAGAGCCLGVFGDGQ